MTSVKDTASFFANGSSNQFDFVLSLYPQVLKLKAENKCKKPEELIRLDDWYQNQLPQLIKKRGKDAHMLHEELVQCMKWKQTRGKFYPQLSYLIKVNTPRAVVTETKKAFKKMPNLEQAITALSNLKGVGTTMASALLAAAAPETAPFMADECLMAIPEIEGIDYTTREYMNFVQHIQATTDRLNEEVHGPSSRSKKAADDDDSSSSSSSSSSDDIPKIARKWSPHNVELALWTHYVARELQPDLLDNMPAAVEGSKNSYSRNPTTNGSGKNNVTPAATTTTTTTTTAEEPPSDESNLDTELAKSGSGATSDESNSKDAIGAVVNNKYIDSLDDECTKSEEDSLEKPTTTTPTVATAGATIRNNNSDEVTADSDSQSSAAKRSTPYDEDEDDDEDEDEEDDGSSADGGAPNAKKPKLD